MTELPRFEVLRPAAWPGLILVSAEYSHHRSAPHAHEEVALGLCPDGLAEFHCGRFHGPVPSGSLLAIEPGQIHWDRAEAGRIRMVYAPLALWGPGPWRFRSPVVTDAVVARDIEALFATPDTWNVFVATLRSRPWVTAERLPTSGWEPWLRRLETHAEPLRALAAEAGLSPFAFLRRFRQEVGCTPHEYSRQARIIRAAQQITGGVPLARAAMGQEFFDQSHFHRHFRTIHSVSPGVFRERNSVQSDRRRTE